MRLRKGSRRLILGTGIDLVKSSRVEAELERGDWRPGEGIFTAGEWEYCRAAARPAGRFAACFAAKEAALKALGTPASDLAVFREVELAPGAGNRYRIRLHDRLRRRSEQLGVKRIRVSIGRSDDLVCATVIMEA
jgi:holo-[acyl-carrier protein] synthase